MNRCLAENIAAKLLPALERSQGVKGSYARSGQVIPLTAIPTSPDWESEDDRGTVIEQYTEIIFLVSVRAWQATGLGQPQDGDRFTCTLADGVARTYMLAAKKSRRPYGSRPWELDATASHYSLHMKWVQA